MPPSLATPCLTPTYLPILQPTDYIVISAYAQEMINDPNDPHVMWPVRHMTYDVTKSTHMGHQST